MSERMMMGFTKKKLRGVSCFRPVYQDPNISDGALRMLMFLKGKAKYGEVTIRQRVLAKEMGISRETVMRRLWELEELRIIKIIPNSKRGMNDACSYFIEDEFYAKRLAKKKKVPRSGKNATGVPIGTTYIPTASIEETPNVIPMPPQIPVSYEPKKRTRKA